MVDVKGVGYKVFVPRHPTADDVMLHTHQVVREDGQFLYGFESREELALFEMLIGVSGVGPKAALAILSVARPAEVAGAIASGDAAALPRAGRGEENRGAAHRRPSREDRSHRATGQCRRDPEGG